MKNQNEIDQLVIDTIRVLSADAVEKAKSGHPGMPMGAAPMAYTLYKDFMHFDPENPTWDNRDRFVLSAGHGSMLLYSLLHLFEYPLTIDDIKSFRQWDSKTPGHPEFGHTVGVEMTTGPLGQGLSSAVGMAIAETMLAKKFNRPDFNIVDHCTYVISGDGCLMEGITSEASSLAGHLKLNKLIVLYDDNSITIDGSTSLAFSEDVKMRYEAYNWQVLEVADGNDIGAIGKAIQAAKAEKNKPTLIKVRTVIGHGAPNLEGTAKTHGAPLGKDEIQAMKKNLDWQYEAFEIPEEVRVRTRGLVAEKQKDYEKWVTLVKKYAKAEPALHKEYEEWKQGDFLRNVDPEALYATDLVKISTRKASQAILNLLADKIPNLVGGSADLAGSNLTDLIDKGDYQADSRGGRNIRFGVREHGMAAIVNGITLHGGFKAFGATFLIFSDYLRPSLRLSALMKIGSLFIFTHDSVALGEDGPTHQPIEQLASMEMIPNLYVFRPADYRETVACAIKSLEISTSPMAVALSRQDLPVLKGSGPKAQRGGYVLVKEEGEFPDLILMGSGSEVQHLVKARDDLKQHDIDARVVSIPCKRLFLDQEKAYREAVLPNQVTKRIAMEAGVGYLWTPFLGKNGDFIGLDNFGASAPGEVVMEKLGITSWAVVEKALKLMEIN